MPNYTGAVDLVSFKDELVNWLRYTMKAYDTQSRVTEATQTFSGTGALTKFTFTNTYLSYIKTVTVGGVSKYYGDDWLVGWRGTDAGKILFNTAPASGTNNIVVVYGYLADGNNMVYPDYPRWDLGLSEYPRIGFMIHDSEVVGGLGGGAGIPMRHTPIVSIKIIDENGQNLEVMMSALVAAIKANGKKFYNFQFIHPTTMSPVEVYEDRTRDVLARIMDFEIPYRYENITWA